MHGISYALHLKGIFFSRTYKICLWTFHMCKTFMYPNETMNSFFPSWTGRMFCFNQWLRTNLRLQMLQINWWYVHDFWINHFLQTFIPKDCNWNIFSFHGWTQHVLLANLVWESSDHITRIPKILPFHEMSCFNCYLVGSCWQSDIAESTIKLHTFFLHELICCFLSVTIFTNKMKLYTFMNWWNMLLYITLFWEAFFANEPEPTFPSAPENGLISTYHLHNKDTAVSGCLNLSKCAWVFILLISLFLIICQRNNITKAYEVSSLLIMWQNGFDTYILKTSSSGPYFTVFKATFPDKLDECRICCKQP